MCTALSDWRVFVALRYYGVLKRLCCVRARARVNICAFSHAGTPISAEPGLDSASDSTRVRDISASRCGGADTVGISMSCVSADLACSTIRLTPWVGCHGRQELEPVWHHSESHVSAPAWSVQDQASILSRHTSLRCLFRSSQLEMNERM